METSQEANKAFGWVAKDKSGIPSPFHFSRRENGDEDVTVKILFCGVCHSDRHTINNHWGFSRYPIIPGHEIVGIATKVGKKVTKFKEGDIVGVGVIIGSCQTCESCNQHLENYCPKLIYTYNSSSPLDGSRNQGGFPHKIVVDHRFVLPFPETLPSDSGAPLLCAGITVYSATKYYGISEEKGKHLGVSGLGGLGHIAVKIGKASGLKVTVISRSLEKERETIDELGADEFLATTDEQKMLLVQWIT
ncbi:unnamed protein product [Cochlearia groenlandica]